MIEPDIITGAGLFVGTVIASVLSTLGIKRAADKRSDKKSIDKKKRGASDSMIAKTDVDRIVEAAVKIEKASGDITLLLQRMDDHEKHDEQRFKHVNEKLDRYEREQAALRKKVHSNTNVLATHDAHIDELRRDAGLITNPGAPADSRRPVR